MPIKLRELFDQYTGGRIDLGMLLLHLPRETTVGELSDLLDQYYQDKE